MILGIRLCYNRVTLDRNQLQSFSGSFVGLRKGRKSSISGFVYKDELGDEKYAKFLHQRSTYHHMTAGDKIHGLFDGENVVEFYINDRFELGLDSYQQWNRYGLIFFVMMFFVMLLAGVSMLWNAASVQPNKG